MRAPSSVTLIVGRVCPTPSSIHQTISTVSCSPVKAARINLGVDRSKRLVTLTGPAFGEVT